MNNLPTTFEELLKLLYKLRQESTAEAYGTIDFDMLAEKVDSLLDQYKAKEQ